jgi:nicotinate phosphoribosyltransferase
LCGVAETLELLKDKKVDIWTLEEGSSFYPYEPVLSIEGPIQEFYLMRTAICGILSSMSGVATKAARCRLQAHGRRIAFFGTRHLVPTVLPFYIRAAYIGGCEGTAVPIGEKILGVEAEDIMEHTPVVVLGSAQDAWRGLKEITIGDRGVFAIVDTFDDETVESLLAAELLGKNLRGIFIDTTKSRRGDFAHIIREVQWKLATRGYNDVSIAVSGGIDEDIIANTNGLVDSYGIGAALANAPAVDFAIDVVAVNGNPRSKRGKFNGVKEIFKCPNCSYRVVRPRSKNKCPKCDGVVDTLRMHVMSQGKVSSSYHNSLDYSRKRCLSELDSLSVQVSNTTRLGSELVP